MNDKHIQKRILIKSLTFPRYEREFDLGTISSILNGIQFHETYQSLALFVNGFDEPV